MKERNEITCQATSRRAQPAWSVADFASLHPVSPLRAGKDQGKRMRKIPQTETARVGDVAAASPEVAIEMVRWLEHLGAERRYSANTLEAYTRDVRQFLEFATAHLGTRP